METTVYIDMDGVLNRFEDDLEARKNMWKPGYFKDIAPLEGIVDALIRINKLANVVILTKVIDRPGVIEEKNYWIKNNLDAHAFGLYDKVIYVPYAESKRDYIKSDYNTNFARSNILIDDGLKNLDECSEIGVYGVYFGPPTDDYPSTTSAQGIVDMLSYLLGESNINKITNIRIEDKAGTIISFITNNAWSIGDKILFEYKDKLETVKCYFQVISISLDSSSIFIIEARQVGHWVNNFKLKKDLDFKVLLEGQISLITDKETINEIDRQSGWC